MAAESLLDSYDSERVFAADENILNSTRSTDFITPKSEASRAVRDATLELARDCAFARRLVNSGRLSIPTVYTASPLNTPDEEAFAGAMVPGAPAVDAPLSVGAKDAWLLGQIGSNFTLLIFDDPAACVEARKTMGMINGVTMHVVGIVSINGGLAGDLVDREQLVARRYDLREGSVYLIRPDQHVAARWRTFDFGRIRTAVARALAKSGPPA